MAEEPMSAIFCDLVVWLNKASAEATEEQKEIERIAELVILLESDSPGEREQSGPRNRYPKCSDCQQKSGRYVGLFCRHCLCKACFAITYPPICKQCQKSLSLVRQPRRRSTPESRLASHEQTNRSQTQNKGNVERLLLIINLRYYSFSGISVIENLPL